MASFRAHFSFGILLGIGAVAVMTGFALADGSSFFVSVFVAAVIGGIMPDMDSDSGIPFHVTFGVLSCIAGSLAFMHVWKVAPNDYWLLVGWPIGAMFFVWTVIGSIFKKLTRHRGMVHSLPAAALSGLSAFLLTQKYGFSESDAFFLSLALTVGYVGHLVLDEIYAAVNFHGVPFIPNKAFGSALKLFSHSNAMNAMVYGLIGMMLMGNWESLVRLTETFKASLNG